MNPFTLLLGYSLWWIFPIIMIAMIILCCFIMCRIGMSCCMACCTRDKNRVSTENDSASRMKM